MNKRQIFLIVILSIIGAVVWIVIGKISNSIEAWDSMYYYILGLPVMCIASAMAGYLEPKKPAVFGLAVIIFQPLALVIQSEMGPLIVVGILFFIFFAVFTIGCAYLGAAVGKKR